MTCTLGMKGYHCTKDAGHEGPCALVYKPGFWRRVGDGLGELLGAMLYQGPK